MRPDRATWLIGLVLYQLFSGLGLVWGEDGAFQHALLVLHAAIGPAALLAFLLYVPRHFQRMLPVPRPTVRAVGLAAAGLIAGAIASGTWILARSALELHTDDSWREYHQRLSFIGAIALAAHLAMVARKARGRSLFRGAAVIGTLCVVVAAVVAGLLFLDPGVRFGVKLSAPVLDPRVDRVAGATELLAAETPAWGTNRSCGTSGCHEKAYQEWMASAHGFADRDPYYLALERRLVREGKLDAVALCNECHDPVMLGTPRFVTWRTQGAKGDVPHTGEAVGCLVCHAMTVGHGRRARGNYTLGVPRRAPFQESAPGAALLRAFPSPHAKAMSPPTYENSQMCAGCHRLDVFQEIAGFGPLRIENPHARWALAGVKPSCQECHMPREDEDGPVSHRFPGASPLSADPEQRKRIAAYLSGDLELPGVKGDLTRGPLLGMSAGPARLTTSGELELDLELHHPGRIGHQFPVGAVDLIQLWIEGELAAGETVLARWGEAAPGGPLLPGTPVFQQRGFHRFADGVREVLPSWRLPGLAFPVLRPGDRYRLTLHAPAAPRGAPPVLSLRLMYRKLSRPALDAIGEPGLALPPATTLARGRWPLEVAP